MNKIPLYLVLLTGFALCSCSDEDDSSECEAFSNKKAVKTCELAYEGDALSQLALAGLFFKGTYVDKSYEEAAKWTTKSAEQGNANAQYNLGGMYLMGKGVEKSTEEAERWFRAAADQGYAKAKQALEKMKK